MSYKVLSSDSIQSLPEDMYKHTLQEMSAQDIQEWLEGILTVCAAHMNSCGEDPSKMDEMDESFLMYENAILFLLGAANAHGAFEQHKGELH